MKKKVSFFFYNLKASFCDVVLYVLSSLAIILLMKRGLIIFELLGGCFVFLCPFLLLLWISVSFVIVAFRCHIH